MEANQLLAYGLTKDSMVWQEGMADWQPVYTIPQLMALISPVAQPQQVYPAQPTASGTVPPSQPAGYLAPSGKDKTVGGILALLLGSIGVQYFYVGKIGGGFLTILLSFVTCGIWGILTFIQGILMLTMTQEDFDRKYVYSTSTLPLF